MNEEQLPQTMLLVGVGGIGTQLAELLVAALRRVNLRGDITLMDADVVEARLRRRGEEGGRTIKSVRELSRLYSKWPSLWPTPPSLR